MRRVALASRTNHFRELVKTIKVDRPGTAGVPACPCPEDQEYVAGPLDEIASVLLEAGRRGRLRSQRDRL